MGRQDHEAVRELKTLSSTGPDQKSSAREKRLSGLSSRMGRCLTRQLSCMPFYRRA